MLTTALFLMVCSSDGSCDAGAPAQDAAAEVDPCQAADNAAAEAYWSWMRARDDRALSIAVTAQFRCVEANRAWYDARKEKAR